MDTDDQRMTEQTEFVPGQEVRWHREQWFVVGPDPREGFDKLIVVHDAPNGAIAFAAAEDLSPLPVDDGPPRTGDRVRDNRGTEGTATSGVDNDDRVAWDEDGDGRHRLSDVWSLTVVERNPNVTVVVEVRRDEAAEAVGFARRWPTVADPDHAGDLGDKAVARFYAALRDALLAKEEGR